jgi:hypothetical protein
VSHPPQKKSDKGFQDGIIALKPDHSATLLDTAGKVGGAHMIDMSPSAARNDSSRTGGSW